uniref:Uncharacterized protein n=1 Tax=viral metagenome TaxID=1070528 RepID=A0A6M3LH29_9ZZZZ
MGTELTEIYEKETGQKAMYRMESSYYHTLRYVRWLEAKLESLEKPEPEPCGHEDRSWFKKGEPCPKCG